MRKLTILVIATPGWGHMNACSGALVRLLQRGHRVVFVIEEAFRGKLASLGYEEFTYPPLEAPEPVPETASSNAGDAFAKSLLDSQFFSPQTPLEKMSNVVEYLDGAVRCRTLQEMDRGIQMALKEIKPDLLVNEGNACLPAVHWSGIPWVKVTSSAPLFYTLDETLPPGGSGFPSAGDRSEWPKWNRLRHGIFYGKGLNDFFESLGYQRFPDDSRSPSSAALTVYAFPDELNYEPIRRNGWFNLEVFNKNSNQKMAQLSQLVPQEFLEDTFAGTFSGKLIYVSMGSLGSIDLQLMKRLVEILSPTRHKYIFAKGPRHEEYSLGGNMWGDRFLPQTAIVPHVDLVITHGGNNSVTETFAQGKPMVVLPLFADQFDNAQRLEETGFGARIDAYNFTEKDICEAIDKLLYNEELKVKIEAASKRIQSTDRHLELALKMEEIGKA